LSTESLPPNRRNWLRIARITAAAVSVVSTLFLFGIVALLNNHAFRQYLIRKTHHQLSDALGAELQVKDFGVHLSGLNPSVDMNGVIISGAAPYNDRPLLRVDHLSAAVRIDSFMQRKWHFSDVQLDHPVVQILVDGQGRSNLPHAKESQTDVFDLGIRHVVVSGGEITYNDHQSALDADLHDVQLQTRFDPADIRYYGTISYSDGQLRLQNYEPITHGLKAKFEATRQQLKLEEASLKSGPSEVDFSATVDDYAHPRLEAHYQAKIDASDVGRIIKDSSLPSGVITSVGVVRYNSEPKRPLIEAVTFDGNMAAQAVQVRTPDKKRVVINDVTANYKLERGNLNLHDVRGRLLGGQVTGQFAIKDVAGSGESQFHGVFRDIGLVQIQALMNTPMPSDVMLTGTTNAEVDVRWKRSFENLVARADAGVHGALRPIRANAPEAFPLTGDIHALYEARSGQVSFERSTVRMPQTEVSLSGSVSSRTAIDLRVQSNDLSEMETLVNAIHPMEQLGLAGSASFAGSLRGALAEPENARSETAPTVTGHLEAPTLHVRGTEWRMLRTDIEAGPDRVILKNGSVQPKARGQLTFNVSAGLSHWVLTDASPIDINVNGSQLDAADVVNLSGVQAAVTGTLSARVSLHGTKMSPVGQGVLSLTAGSIYDEPVNSASVNFNGTGDAVRGAVDVRLPAGAAQGNLAYFPKNRGYEAQLRSTGFRIDQLHALKSRNVQLAGTLSLDAKGMGTLDDPALEVRVSAPRIQVQNQLLNGLTLQANIRDHVANVALDSESKDVFVRGKGTVQLSGNYDVDAVFDTSPISLQPLLAAYLPSQANGITGQTEVHARVRGPLNDKSQLDGRVTIPSLTLNYQNIINLSAASPIQIDYAKGVLTVQPATIRGTGTDLQFQGTIPVTGSAPVAIRAVGAIDLRVAQLFNPDLTSSGQLRFNIDGVNRPAGSNVQGEIQIVNANFAAAGLPVGLQNGNGLLKLTNDAIVIDQFRGNVGNGALTAQGRVAFQPAVQFNVSVATTGIRTSYPQGVRETLDANLTMIGSAQAAEVRGRVRLQDISFMRDYDAAELVSQFAGDTPAPPQGFANKLKLDISVQSSSDLNLTSSKLSVQGAANLQVKGTAADPVLTGRMRLDGGDLIFRGNRYVLQPSTVEFINPVKTEPVLNVVVDSKVKDYDINMRLRGPLDRLRTTYTSDPTLPQADIINLLVFGKTTESAGATPGNLGAESLIASAVSSEVTSRVEKVAGISQLSVDPTLGPNEKNPGARITIQQRVSGNLFVTFATDATSTERQVVKLEYQMSPRMSVSGVRDQNGGFAFDVRIKKSW
jgi:translocation and assembly module TamB